MVAGVSLANDGVVIGLWGIWGNRDDAAIYTPLQIKREGIEFSLGLYHEQTFRDELGGELGSGSLEECHFPGEEVDPGVGEEIRGVREGGGNVLGEGHGWEGKNAHG